MIYEADANHDGLVDFSEFLSIQNKYFVKNNNVEDDKEI